MTLLVSVYSAFDICILVLFVKTGGFYNLRSMHCTLEVFSLLLVYRQHVFQDINPHGQCLCVGALFHTVQIDARKSRNGGQNVLQGRAEKYALKIMNFLKDTVNLIKLFCFVFGKIVTWSVYFELLSHFDAFCG